MTLAVIEHDAIVAVDAEGVAVVRVRRDEPGLVALGCRGRSLHDVVPEPSRH